MADHPIIFSGPMVRALLESRKIMTRRLAWQDRLDRRTKERTPRRSPWQRVSVGDRLWVREKLAAMANWGLWHDAGPVPDVLEFLDVIDPRGGALLEKYAPTEATDSVRIPSIHMPRWASRLTLTITGVKIERLQDISEVDAQAEGVIEDDGSEPGIWYIPGTGGVIDMEPITADNPVKVFAGLWRALHGADSWQENPEVVALSFTIQQANIDRSAT